MDSVVEIAWIGLFYVCMVSMVVCGIGLLVMQTILNEQEARHAEVIKLIKQLRMGKPDGEVVSDAWASLD